MFPFRKLLTRLIPLALLIAGLIVPATGFAQGKSLEVAIPRAPRTMDPSQVHSFYDVALLANIYDGLVSRDDDFRLKPGLARSWTLVEPTRWRFFLREDVRFHDGSPFTAADVIRNFDNLQDHSNGLSVLINGIKDIQRIDDFTVDFVTESFLPVPMSGWHNWLLVSRDAAAKDDATEQNEDPKNPDAKGKSNGDEARLKRANGTGAFLLAGNQAAGGLVLGRNKDWWGKGSDSVMGVILTPQEGADKRLAALLAGKVDVALDLAPEAIAKLKDAKGYSLAAKDGLKTVFLFFDQGRDPLPHRVGSNPLKDIRVRQALRAGIDYDALVSKTLKDSAVVASTMVPEILGRQKMDPFPRPYQPKEARSLLHDTGYRHGISVRLECPVGLFRDAKQVCEDLAEKLRDAGFRIAVDRISIGDFVAQAGNKGDYHMGLMAWQPPTADAWNLLYNVLGSWNPNSRRGLFNFSRIVNMRIDDLIEKTHSEGDAKRRAAMIAEALKIVRDQIYYIPLYRERHLAGTRNGVSLPIRADGRALFYQATVK